MTYLDRFILAHRAAQDHGHADPVAYAERTVRCLMSVDGVPPEDREAMVPATRREFEKNQSGRAKFACEIRSGL